MASFGLGPLVEEDEGDDAFSQHGSSSRPASRRVSMDEYYYSHILGRQSANQTPSASPPTYDDATIPNDLPALSRRKSPPRDGEGMEQLPPYTCSIAIENVFMRKMELESAVHKAHDRNWYKTYVRLQGTALCIHRVKTSSFFPKQSAGPNVSADMPPGKKPGELLRTYNLQHAEVGIAADYRKRLYVIRVRVEADQFLLSCIEIETFLLWLESLCAAINLAPPLEERKLPREYTVPRTRRRRARILERNEALVREQREIMRAYYPQLLDEPIPEEGLSDDVAEIVEPSPPHTDELEVDRPISPPLDNFLRRPSTTAVSISTPETGHLSVPTEAPPLYVRHQEQSPSPLSIPSTEVKGEQSQSLPLTTSPPSLSTPLSTLPPPTSTSGPRQSLPLLNEDEITPAPPLFSQPNGVPQARAPLALPHPPSQAPPGAHHPSISPETGKWQPTHNWSTMYDRLYAKRCIDVLLNKSPRKTNLIIMQGKRWFIDWATGAVTRCDPPLYNEINITGPWGLMPSNMIVRT